MTLATWLECCVTAAVVSTVTWGTLYAVPWFKMKRSQWRLRMAMADAEVEIMAARMLAGYREDDVSRETRTDNR